MLFKNRKNLALNTSFTLSYKQYEELIETILKIKTSKKIIFLFKICLFNFCRHYDVLLVHCTSIFSVKEDNVMLYYVHDRELLDEMLATHILVRLFGRDRMIKEVGFIADKYKIIARVG